MINHIRTLLINRNLPNNSQYGSEYTDPSFVPIVMTPQCELIHETLFGSDPDELTLNYRASQYLNLLYSDVQIGQYLDALDPRNTYRNDVWPKFSFTSKALINEGSTLAPYMELIGAYQGVDAFGQNLMNFNLTLNNVLYDPPRLIFTYKNHNLVQRVIQMKSSEVENSQIISNPDLPGLLFLFSDVSFFIGNTGTDDFEARSEPSRDLSEIANTLIRAGVTQFDFQVPAEYKDDFERLRKYRTNSLQKLVGILLSYIYENEKVRRNGQT